MCVAPPPWNPWNTHKKMRPVPYRTEPYHSVETGLMTGWKKHQLLLDFITTDYIIHLWPTDLKFSSGINYDLKHAGSPSQLLSLFPGTVLKYLNPSVHVEPSDTQNAVETQLKGRSVAQQA